MRARKAVTDTADPIEHPDWSALLIEAVEEPGIISAAYSQCYDFSVGNMLLAQFQCFARGLTLGPLHTYKGWHKLGRQVRRGERALTLCMPLTVKRKAAEPQSFRIGDGAERQHASHDGAASDGSPTTATIFVYKPLWFVLSQTDGEPYLPIEVPEWNEAQALHALMIDRVPFVHPNGNTQGYAHDRSVAISPIAGLPHKTLFHELAHVVLGHTAEGSTRDDHDHTPRTLREVEAESVALLCVASLNLSGIAECRGYIQSWLGSEPIPEPSVQKIFRVADQILRAGRVPQQPPAEPEKFTPSPTGT